MFFKLNSKLIVTIIRINEKWITYIYRFIKKYFWSHWLKNKIKEYLEKDSSNINILNEEGLSPLHIAIINGNLEVIKLLLKYGADPNIKSLNNELNMRLIRIIYSNINIENIRFYVLA